MKETTNGFHGVYRFLSNFWPASVKLDGMEYPTVEHAYQAAKTIKQSERKAVRDCTTPGLAKRMGRTLTIIPDWNKDKFPIMRLLLEQKFAIPELREMLLATKGTYLVEYNTWNDTTWGVCNGKGSNILGKMLMAIRDKEDVTD